MGFTLSFFFWLVYKERSWTRARQWLHLSIVWLDLVTHRNLSPPIPMSPWITFLSGKWITSETSGLPSTNCSENSVKNKWSENAVFGGGEYELVEEFRNKEVPHSMSIRMSLKQWKKHIEKVYKIHFSADEQPCPTGVRPCLWKQLSTKWENAKIEHVHFQRL